MSVVTPFIYTKIIITLLDRLIRTSSTVEGGNEFRKTALHLAMEEELATTDHTDYTQVSATPR